MHIKGNPPLKVLKIEEQGIENVLILSLVPSLSNDYLLICNEMRNLR